MFYEMHHNQSTPSLTKIPADVRGIPTDLSLYPYRKQSDPHSCGLGFCSVCCGLHFFFLFLLGHASVSAGSVIKYTYTQEISN